VPSSWGSVAITPSVLQWALDVATQTYGIGARDMLSVGRTKEVAHARQYAMWLLRCRKHASGEAMHGFVTIGRAFSRDHTTAMHACRAVEKRLLVGPSHDLAKWRALGDSSTPAPAICTRDAQGPAPNGGMVAA
jgi:hypothetical protein